MMRTRRTFQRILPAALAMATAIFPQNKSGSLLDGLNVPPKEEAPAPEYPPADVKVNDGTFRLKWMGEANVMGNLSRTSLADRGWVLLNSGEKIEGKFSVKARKGKKETRWSLTEIDFKDESKRKVPGAEVEDFAYVFKIEDYTDGGKRISKNPANNFHPGSIVLADGAERAGMVAILTRYGIPGGGGYQVYFAADANAEIEQFKPKALARVTQKREDGPYDYVAFNNGIMPAIVNGKNFLFFRNPYSTTKSKGGLAMLGNMANGVVADQAGKAAARGAAKDELNRQAKSGADLGTAVTNAGAAADDAYQTTSSNLSGAISIGGEKPEYVIRNVKSGFQVVVNDENHLAKLGELMKACSALEKMSAEERKEISRFKNLENLVRTLDGCF